MDCCCVRFRPCSIQISPSPSPRRLSCRGYGVGFRTLVLQAMGMSLRTPLRMPLRMLLRMPLRMLLRQSRLTLHHNPPPHFLYPALPCPSSTVNPNSDTIPLAYPKDASHIIDHVSDQVRDEGKKALRQPLTSEGVPTTPFPAFSAFVHHIAGKAASPCTLAPISACLWCSNSATCTTHLCGCTPHLCGCTPHLCGCTPHLCGCTPYLCGCTPHLCGCTPHLCGCTPHLCGCTPHLCGCTHHLCGCTPHLCGSCLSAPFLTALSHSHSLSAIFPQCHLCAQTVCSFVQILSADPSPLSDVALEQASPYL